MRWYKRFILIDVTHEGNQSRRVSFQGDLSHS